MKTYKQFQSITEVYKDLPVGRMSDKISKLSIDLGRQAEIRGREVYGGKRNAIRKSIGINPKKRPERETPGRSEHISKQVLRLAKIKNAIASHDPELSGKLNAINKIRGAKKNLENRMSRQNQIVPFQRRKVQEAYMEIYENNLNESLADMFAAAYDDLDKNAQKHALESQKRLKAIKKKMSDAEKEIARQDAEIDSGMDMKRRPAKKKVEEAYKEPNLERMQRQADKFSRTSERMRSAYKKDEPAHKSDLERIYKRKKETTDYDTWQGKNKAYYRDSFGKVDRGQHSGDLLSVQNRRKYELRNYVENPERKSRNIRAKIQQHQNDPLGYMSKTFGGPHIDSGMDMKRRPRKRKVQEAYKDPNPEKLKNKVEKIKSDARQKSHQLFKQFQSIIEAYKDPDIDKIYDQMGRIYKKTTSDAERHSKQGEHKKAENIYKKASSRTEKMAKVMHDFDSNPDMYALDRMAKIPLFKKQKKVQEAYKEPNLERMKKQANNADIGTILKYTRHKDIQDDISKIYKNKPAGKQKEVPVYYRDSSGSIGRRRHPKDLLSNQNAIKFDMKKYQVDKNTRRAQNIRAKIQQYHADPLGYMSRSFGGPTINPEGWQNAPKRRKTK